MIFCKQIAINKMKTNQIKPEIKPLPVIPTNPPAPDRIENPGKNMPEHPRPDIIQTTNPEIKPIIRQNNLNNKCYDR